MGQNGFLPQDLFFLRKMWDDSGVLVEDSYGQEWVRQSIAIAHMWYLRKHHPVQIIIVNHVIIMRKVHIVCNDILLHLRM